jgi:hypothetical protein
MANQQIHELPNLDPERFSPAQDNFIIQKDTVPAGDPNATDGGRTYRGKLSRLIADPTVNLPGSTSWKWNFLDKQQFPIGATIVGYNKVNYNLKAFSDLPNDIKTEEIQTSSDIGYPKLKNISFIRDIKGNPTGIPKTAKSLLCVAFLHNCDLYLAGARKKALISSSKILGWDDRRFAHKRSGAGIVEGWNAYPVEQVFTVDNIALPSESDSKNIAYPEENTLSFELKFRLGKAGHVRFGGSGSGSERQRRGAWDTIKSYASKVGQAFGITSAPQTVNTQTNVDASVRNANLHQMDPRLLAALETTAYGQDGGSLVSSSIPDGFTLTELPMGSGGNLASEDILSAAGITVGNNSSDRAFLDSLRANGNFDVGITTVEIDGKPNTTLSAFREAVTTDLKENLGDIYTVVDKIVFGLLPNIQLGDQTIGVDFLGGQDYASQIGRAIIGKNGENLSSILSFPKTENESDKSLIQKFIESPYTTTGNLIGGLLGEIPILGDFIAPIFSTATGFELLRQQQLMASLIRDPGFFNEYIVGEREAILELHQKTTVAGWELFYIKVLAWN